MSVNVIYYLKCKMCNKKETYIGKTIRDNTKGFKVRINQNIKKPYDDVRVKQHQYHIV